MSLDTTNLLTFATLATGLACVLLSTDDDMAMKAVMALEQQKLAETVVGPCACGMGCLGCDLMLALVVLVLHAGSLKLG